MILDFVNREKIGATGHSAGENVLVYFMFVEVFPGIFLLDIFRYFNGFLYISRYFLGTVFKILKFFNLYLIFI